MKIKEIFEKPIDRKIEEVIKVTQVDEQVVYEEISEYVVTDSIKYHYMDILKAISEAPSSPHEGIGIWISGFFGSGKSSFAKILGYILEGKPVLDKDARELFKHQAHDKTLSDLLEYLKVRIPIKSMVFDVSQDRGVRSASDRITEIIYKVLLRELDYAEDFDIAKLEQELEQDAKLEEFITKYEAEYPHPWKKGRKRSSGLNEASRILHLMDSSTYNQPDSWVRSLGVEGKLEGRADICANELAQKAFELMERRGDKKGLVIVIDEVGQYVSRSVDKMLDLQAVVQALGVEGKNRVKQGKAVSPVWLIVTSQETLDEVVSALDDRRIELARLKDRFPTPVDLAPVDIAEVTGKRILSKKPDALPVLGKLYEANQHRLNQCCKLEKTKRKSEIFKDEFISLYPYLPFYIDLCIDIMSGIRNQPGAQRHIGGSNRTIIKQAQQMLINPKVNLCELEVGSLVTIDKVYDLIENNLSSTKQRDIFDIKNRFSDDEYALKVAKAICLLEFVRDLPITAENISAVLYSHVGAESCLRDVEQAIKELEKAQFIRFSDGGYKLLTVQEKTWDTKRNGLSPKPADRKEILRECLKEIFSEPSITKLKYKNLKTFSVGFSCDSKSLILGDIDIDITLAEDNKEYNEAIEERKRTSRQAKENIFALFQINDEIHRLVEEQFRSARMLQDYERLAAQGQLPPEEHKCFSDEKHRLERYRRELRDSLKGILLSGCIIFRGLKKDISDFGDGVSEGIRKILVDTIIPELFPKFDMGGKLLKGNESDNILNASNLNGLPSVFYDDDLNLVVQQGDKYVPNPNADIAQEIMRFIKEKHDYGEKVSGKLLEENFCGIGYGWERDMLRLVLSVLFRGGAVEITSGGKRFKDYHEPVGKQAITNNVSFRNATFSPRATMISFKEIKNACENYESITGNEIDAEEAEIASALKNLALEQKDILLPLDGQIRALGLPCAEFVSDLLCTMTQLPENNSDDCVKYLADEGKALRISLEKVKKIQSAVTDNLPLIKKAKDLVSNVFYSLKQIVFDDDSLHETMDRLKDNIEAEDFYDRLSSISKDAEVIYRSYSERYDILHTKRNDIYQQLEEKFKGLSEWESIPEAIQENTIRKITSKICSGLQLDDSSQCKNCRATIMQIDSDISACSGIEKELKKTIDEFISKTNENIERVKLSDYFNKSISDLDEFKEQLEKLLSDVQMMLKEGKKVIME